MGLNCIFKLSNWLSESNNFWCGDRDLCYHISDLSCIFTNSLGWFGNSLLLLSSDLVYNSCSLILIVIVINCFFLLIVDFIDLLLSLLDHFPHWFSLSSQSIIYLCLSFFLKLSNLKFFCDEVNFFNNCSLFLFIWLRFNLSLLNLSLSIFISFFLFTFRLAFTLLFGLAFLICSFSFFNFWCFNVDLSSLSGDFCLESCAFLNESLLFNWIFRSLGEWARVLSWLMFYSNFTSPFS